MGTKIQRIYGVLKSTLRPYTLLNIFSIYTPGSFPKENIIDVLEMETDFVATARQIFKTPF